MQISSLISELCEYHKRCKLFRVRVEVKEINVLKFVEFVKLYFVLDNLKIVVFGFDCREINAFVFGKLNIVCITDEDEVAEEAEEEEEDETEGITFKETFQVLSKLFEF